MNNTACVNYEKSFNEAIDNYNKLSNFAKIRAWADKCISLHTAYGLDAISAGAYMDKVIEMYQTDKKNLDEWAVKFGM